MNFYFLKMQIDHLSQTDCTQFRSASYDFNEMQTFLNNQDDIKSAMLFFKKISFFLDEVGINPIGDIFSESIYSYQAGSLIKKMRGNFELFEPIKINSKSGVIHGFFIAVDYIENGAFFEKIEDDIFCIEYPSREICVSERFKLAWESSGLLGAEFQAHDAAQLTIDANAKKARLDALMMKKQ